MISFGKVDKSKSGLGDVNEATGDPRCVWKWETGRDGDRKG